MKQEDARIVYADIIDHEHHRSATRTPMSLYDRAAQFAAYDALAGYYDMIAEEARITEREITPDESAVELLDRQLALLQEGLSRGQHPRLCLRVFVPDPRKPGGAYESVSGRLKRIDAQAQSLVLGEAGKRAEADRSIAFAHITAISEETP